MNRTRLAIIFALSILCCLSSQVTTRAAARPYQELVDAYFKAYFAAQPTAATSIGFHEYDNRFEDFSLAAHIAEQKNLHTFLQEFEAVDTKKLSMSERDDYELIVNQIKGQLLEEEKIQFWRRNPDLYSGAVTGSIYSLMERDFAPAEARLHSVIEREKQMPGALQEAKKLLENPPEIYTQIALQQLPAMIDFFQTTVPQAFQTVKDKQELDEFAHTNAQLIAALKDYQNFLKNDLLPRSHGNFALGEENYRLKLAYEQMVDTSIDRLLEVGYAQLHKDQQAFIETARRIDANKDPLAVLALIEKDHPSETELLPTAQRLLDKLRQFVKDHHIISIPGDIQAKVIETPPFDRALTFASMDTPGAFETKATESYYNITLPEPEWSASKKEEYLEGYNNPLISIVSIHEVWPGHYEQFLSVRNNSQLSKVRKLIGASSNSEGWAHYSEQMMLDEGYGNNDPKLRLAQLIDALLRDCRYIVALQMHTRGMTIEQATDFFVKEGHQKRVVGEREALRGTSDPTYLVYTLGKLQILKLREDYRHKLGDKFDLQEFHNQFINLGRPPIKIVRRELMGEDGPLL